MAYVRLASGYRPGGPNTQAAQFDFPPSYKPDKTYNYEIGVKADLLDHRLSADASLYYIDWKDMQFTVYNPDNYQAYVTNAGGAKSQGVELAVQARPVQSLTLKGWVTWADVKLTSDIPPNSAASAPAGSRLPYSTRFSGNLSFDERFPIATETTGFVGAMVSYVGEREGEFSGAGTPRQTFPAYTKTDLRAGFEHSSWTGELYVTNLTDRRGIIGGGVYPPFAFTYIQPRTMGVQVAKQF